MGLKEKIKNFKQKFKEDKTFRTKVIVVGTVGLGSIFCTTAGYIAGKNHSITGMNTEITNAYNRGRLDEANITLEDARTLGEIVYRDVNDRKDVTKIIVSEVKEFKED